MLEIRLLAAEQTTRYTGGFDSFSVLTDFLTDFVFLVVQFCSFF